MFRPKYYDSKWWFLSTFMPCSSQDSPHFPDGWWRDCSMDTALLIKGRFALMTWLANSCRKAHSSVSLFSALGSALELSPSLPQCHITHAPSLPPLHRCLATAVLVPLARQERDKWITRKTPSFVISHTICRKAQSECSVSMLSLKQPPEDIFVTIKGPLVSTTVKIRGPSLLKLHGSGSDLYL